jgi:hypothetical protein
MEQTECSETSAYKIQRPGNFSEEIIQDFYSIKREKILRKTVTLGLVLRVLFEPLQTQYTETNVPTVHKSLLALPGCCQGRARWPDGLWLLDSDGMETLAEGHSLE